MAIRRHPNAERFNDLTVTNWNFKVFGTYQAPWGITTTGSVRHQSGNNLSRDITTQRPDRTERHRHL